MCFAYANYITDLPDGQIWLLFKIHLSPGEGWKVVSTQNLPDPPTMVYNVFDFSLIGSQFAISFLF